MFTDKDMEETKKNCAKIKEIENNNRHQCERREKTLIT